ncbi:MAG: AAA family ATPase [Candidatus Bathyarchaeota archaeon]|nr:MAG: AAA family ATPase [Candidatus Bathyarchaeota archaeon]
MVIELSHEEARGTCVHEFAQCTSSEDLPPLKEIIGQDRALRALKFGLQIQDKGFNIYVAGMPGTGRKTAIINFLEEIAKDRAVPPDWCYVNNFQDPNRPNALKLPAGKGAEFKRDMEEFVSEFRKSLSTAFESDEYTQRRTSTLKALDDEREAVTKQVNSMAANAGFLLQRSPIGLLLVPIVQGRPINEQEFTQLPPNAQAEIQKRRGALQERLRGYIRQFRDLEKKADEAVKALNRSVATFALEPIFSTLREKFSDCSEVLIFLGEVSEDILNKLPDILKGEQDQQRQLQLPFMPTVIRGDPAERYKVNLLVDNSKIKGAPVVMELNPTYARLFGGTEKEARFGALVTDYTMITGGSAHRSNGGFLVVPVEGLFTNPMVWETLKLAISNEKLEIEEPTERMGFMLTKSLRPEPIPFDAKLVLVGNPQVYQVLYTMDRDFKELFKVKADFDTTMDRDEENVMQYASFMCTLCNKEDLLHLEPQGMAAVVEYSSRLASDKSKLSTQFAEVADIIREANFYAREDGAKLITRQHVQKALEEKVYRSNLIEKKIDEMIAKNVLLIETEGEVVGQVNGLAVLSLGDYGFGKPSRITASVGVGKKGIIDIEREAEMGGPTHTKGVLIISGFLNDRFAKEEPLSLTARLVFEQSYSGVDGDSASSTELYSLLSALSGKPIRQHLAVTGSVNQKGEVQAIGGVNEKIEGFYEVCKAKGLTGKEGVVIPYSNVQNLMLKEEVVEVIKEGRFHIYPVKTISEGIEVLTGVNAGERRPDGSYEEGTINDLSQRRLLEMAEKIKEYRE